MNCFKIMRTGIAILAAFLPMYFLAAELCNSYLPNTLSRNKKEEASPVLGQNNNKQ